MDQIDFTCQSEYGIDSQSQCYFTNENKTPVTSNSVKLFDETDNYTDDLKTSLQKLDHLITVLNHVYNVCRKNESASYQNEETQVEKVSLNPEPTELVTFNVNINDDNFVHCHAKKGKYSLKIIDTISGKSRLNPFGLHRCPPELEISKDFGTKDVCDLLTKQSFNRKEPMSDFFKNTIQLRRSFHTLSNELGGCSTNLREEILIIKNEIQGLKHFFGKAECVLDNSDISKVTFNLGDLSQWFLETKTNVGKSLLSADDVRMIHGKIRAANFCKFYKLAKACKRKTKKVRFAKKAIAV